MNKIIGANSIILQRMASCVLLAASLTLATVAHAEDDIPLTTFKQKHAACLRPAFTTDDAGAVVHPDGYNINLEGEHYTVILKERLNFSVFLENSKDSVADLHMERAERAEFEEQIGWRADWLADIAERSNVELDKQEFSKDALLLTVNKQELTGKFAGLSLLIDKKHHLFIQWDWKIMPRYTSTHDLVAMQTTLIKKLIPCFLD